MYLEISIDFGSARWKTNYQDIDKDFFGKQEIDKELIQHISKWIRFCFMKFNAF